MIKTYFVALLLILLGMSFMNCSKGHGVSKEKAETQLISSRIYANKDMNTIQVKKGETFEVSLDSNPSTGFSWAINGDLPKAIEYIGIEFAVPAPSDPPRVGQGGKEVWTFKALEKGTFSFPMKYIQPFNPDHIEEERKIEVEVE